MKIDLFCFKYALDTESFVRIILQFVCLAAVSVFGHSLTQGGSRCDRAFSPTWGGVHLEISRFAGCGIRGAIQFLPEPETDGSGNAIVSPRR